MALSPPNCARLLTVLMAAGSFAACSSSEPPPHESALLERFGSQRETFTAIAEWARPKTSVVHLRIEPLDEQAAQTHGLDAEEIEKLQALGIESVSLRHWDPLELRLTVWYRDLLGPGGYQVTYAYCENEPAKLVESIEPLMHPSLRNQTEAYRRIEGNWYLFYYAVD